MALTLSEIDLSFLNILLEQNIMTQDSPLSEFELNQTQTFLDDFWSEPQMCSCSVSQLLAVLRFSIFPNVLYFNCVL